MDRQGYIDFIAKQSPDNSGKAGSYATALEILDEVLPYQHEINLYGQSLYEISDIDTLKELRLIVLAEQRKMRNGEKSIFDYGDSNQTSYPLDNFCSAAMGSLIKYAQVADDIVINEHDPQEISKKLIKHFDIAKEGIDELSISKQRRGQNYFRRMILTNYEGKCAVTGIDIPQLLLASHIIPWKDKSYKKERLNPCNGICLSALYDKAFDKGLITISPDNYTVQLSSALHEYKMRDYYDKHFGSIRGQQIHMPIAYQPNRDFLAYHREKVFLGK